MTLHYCFSLFDVMKYFIVHHFVDTYPEFHELWLVGMVLLMLCDCFNNGGTKFLSIWLRAY